MASSNPFKWRHFEGAIILLCVRWYLRYSLSYRDLEEMMIERGLPVDHSTICRWVHRYAPQLERRIRAQLRPTNDSWRVDETYIKVRGEWMYLYRALDSAGNTVEFMFSPYRHAGAAEYFFRKALASAHTAVPRVINVDGNAAYPPAFQALQRDGTLLPTCELRLGPAHMTVPVFGKLFFPTRSCAILLADPTLGMLNLPLLCPTHGPARFGCRSHPGVPAA